MHTHTQGLVSVAEAVGAGLGYNLACLALNCRHVCCVDPQLEAERANGGKEAVLCCRWQVTAEQQLL